MRCKLTPPIVPCTRAKRTTTWDFPQKRGVMRLDNLKTGTFTFQLTRCDLPEPTTWVVQGDSSAAPSSYMCHKIVCPEQKPFWPLPPKGNVFNGTEVINGVTCNRFDFASTMGGLRSSFWATSTAPCRASHATQREDFMTFNGTEPAASAFDVPAWLNGLDCSKATTV